MPAYCGPCKRPFNGQRELDQHIRDSPKHNEPTRRPSQVQDIPRVKLPPIMPKKQEQATPSLVKPAKPQQAVNAGYRINNATLQKHGQPPIAIASGSSTPKTTIPAVKTTPQSAISPWSVIANSEYMAVLKELSAHCHSLEELKENGYILRPYNPLDYVNTRKCKRCKSKFLV
jgi:hypothetical protein